MESQEGGSFNTKSSLFTGFYWGKQSHEKNQNVHAQKKLQHELAQQHAKRRQTIELIFLSSVISWYAIISTRKRESGLFRELSWLLVWLEESVF